MAKTIIPRIEPGSKFGRWVTLGELEHDGPGKWLVLCRCSCEKQTERRVNHNSLRKGTSTSCGCISKEKARASAAEVALGQQFGRWTVLGEGPRSKHNQRTLLCECSCEAHTRKHVLLHSLLAGKSTGCTCVNRDVVGERAAERLPKPGTTFGRWTVIGPAERDIRGQAQCLCECSCADKTQKVVNVGAMKAGMSRSCGCLHKEAITTHGRSKDKAAYCAQYQKDNKEKIAARKKEQRKKVPELTRLYTANRRARKLNATPPWGREETSQAFLELSAKARELYKQTGVEHHIDHRVPLIGKIGDKHVVCGLHTAANLQLLTAEENLTKNCYVWPDMP